MKNKSNLPWKFLVWPVDGPRLIEKCRVCLVPESHAKAFMDLVKLCIETPCTTGNHLTIRHDARQIWEEIFQMNK